MILDLFQPKWYCDSMTFSGLGRIWTVWSSKSPGFPKTLHIQYHPVTDWWNSLITDGFCLWIPFGHLPLLCPPGYVLVAVGSMKGFVCNCCSVNCLLTTFDAIDFRMVDSCVLYNAWYYMLHYMHYTELCVAAYWKCWGALGWLYSQYWMCLLKWFRICEL